MRLEYFNNNKKEDNLINMILLKLTRLLYLLIIFEKSYNVIKKIMFFNDSNVNDNCF